MSTRDHEVRHKIREAILRAAEKGRQTRDEDQRSRASRSLAALTDQDREARRWISEVLPGLIHEAAVRGQEEVEIGWNEARKRACRSAGVYVRTSGAAMYVTVPGGPASPRQGPLFAQSRVDDVEIAHPGVWVDVDAETIRVLTSTMRRGEASLSVVFHGLQVSAEQVSAAAAGLAVLRDQLEQLE